jgi:hypothetical protein
MIFINMTLPELKSLIKEVVKESLAPTGPVSTQPSPLSPESDPDVDTSVDEEIRNMGRDPMIPELNPDYQTKNPLPAIKLESPIKLKSLIPESIEKVFEENKEWVLHNGARHDKDSKVSVYFTEDKKVKKIWFEVNYKGVCKTDGKNNENMDKWSKKATRTFSGLAKNKYKNPELNEIGNPIQKSWVECFMEALKDESMKPFIKNYGVEEKNAPIMDPINFSPRI